MTKSYIWDFVSRQNADFSAPRQMRVFFSFKMSFPRPWQKKSPRKAFWNFKAQNPKFMSSGDNFREFWNDG